MPVVLVSGVACVSSDVGGPVTPVIGISVVPEFAKASPVSLKKSSKVRIAIYLLLLTWWPVSKSCVAASTRLEEGNKKALRVRRAVPFVLNGPRRFLRAPLELRLPGRVYGLRTSPTARYEYLVVLLD